jgi:hypothetical protein
MILIVDGTRRAKLRLAMSMRVHQKREERLVSHGVRMAQQVRGFAASSPTPITVGLVSTH